MSSLEARKIGIQIASTVITFNITANMLFKHLILFGEADALEKVQKLDLNVLKGFRHVPYEAPVQHLRLFSLTHRPIRGNLIFMFKITHSLFYFP